jgi:transposase
VPSPISAPLTVEALLGVIAERDAQVVHLTLLVDKPRLQLARRAREQYGSSSEQLPLMTSETAQTTTPAAMPPKKEQRRKRERKPRELPAHLPRETQVHHPRATRHKRRAPAASAAASCAKSAKTQPSSWSTCPGTSR